MKTAVRLVLGAAVASALAATPVSAGGGWGYSGYRQPHYGGGYHGGCYGGCGNGGAIAAAAIGGLLFGGLLGAAAASPRPQGYTISTVTPGVVGAPVYPAYPSYPAPQPYPAPQGYPAPYPAPAIPPNVVAGATAASAQAEMCARAAERFAQGTGGFARATGVGAVNGDQANAVVTGTLEIANGAPGQPGVVGFTCWASYGTVTGVKLG